MKDKSLIGMLFFVLFWSIIGLMTMSIQGCSMSSFLVGVKSEDPVVLIDAPPVRLTYSGKFSDRDTAQLMEVLHIMEKIPYMDHTYSFPLSAQISINEGDHTSSSTHFEGSATSKKSR